LRLTGAIVLETLALAIWNVGTRSPAAVLRDVRRARETRSLAMGVGTFLVGLIFVAAATVLLLPAVPNKIDLLVPTEIFTFLVALGLEYIVGEDLRSLFGSRARVS
jgi:hypothetical protein